LCNLCEEGRKASWFYKQVAWKLGSGDKVLFWEDRWIGDNTLKQNYLILYLFFEDKGKCVHQMDTWLESGWSWNLAWRRNPFI